MPEYSSTTITPSDGVRVPSMNGSTSGNFLLSALKSYILSEKGLANGLASLDGNGKLTASQLPDLADDVIVVSSYATLPATGTAGKLYITADNNKMYRWDPDLATPDYVELSVDLSAYATKAELAEEESAREAADSNLLSAIQGNTARIENLEQEHGGYVTVNYRGTNDVPPNKAKYALVESIVGKSRAWNQLIDKSYASTETINGITFTNNGDGSWTLTGATGASTAQKQISPYSMVAGHKYLLSGCPTNNNDCLLAYIGQGSDVVDSGSGAIATIDYSYKATFLYVRANTNLNNPVTFWPISRDLTLIFPEGVPSTIAECVAKCPDLLKYDAYGYSLVDTVVEGVKSVGVNIWDEEWENGSYDLSTGSKSASVDNIRSKNYISCLSNTNYYIRITEDKSLFALFYDANKNFISAALANQANGFVKNTPSNCCYITFYCGSSYGATYNHDIQICLNSYADKNTYHPYKTHTITLPTPVTGKSAGSVHQIYYPETGEMTEPLGSVDLGTLNWTYQTTSSILAPYFYAYFNGIKSLGNPAAVKHNILTAKYVTVARNITNFVDKTICADGYISQITQIQIKDSAYTDATTFKASLSGVMLYYELETPNPNSQATNPVIADMIETEGGGTIETIQNNVYPDDSPAPVIDNCLDVGYLAL